MALTIAGYTYVYHKLIARPWGPECRFGMLDSNGQHIDDVIPIPSMDITVEALKTLVSNHLIALKAVKDRQEAEIAYEALVCHAFDASGTELQEALCWVVKKIRQNPNATVVQAETAWNSEWADSLFTWAKLVVFLQKRLGNITWAEFKTYVIDHKFAGVDH